LTRAPQIAALVALLVVVVAAVEATAAPQAQRRYAVRSTAEISSNWAGYAAIAPDGSSPIQFTSVTGTWTQSAAACTNDANSASAVWVGLGGYDVDSQALEQIGTDADCSRAGKPTYYAWYELVPAPPVNLKFKINPGDTITTSVNVKGNVVTLQLINRTRNVRFTKVVAVNAPDLSSAEWIAEAPSSCSDFACRPIPLTNFGSVAFSKIAMKGNVSGTDHPGTLTDPAWSVVPIQLVPRARGGFFPGQDHGVNQSDSTAGTSLPQGLGPDGRGFALSWLPNATSGA
jgi:hypothetical protein